MLGADTPEVVFDWLADGIAVLELHTAKGIVLVTGVDWTTGTSVPRLIFNRVMDLEHDPRSELKVAAFDPRLLSKDMIESHLGAARGIYDVDRINLTFTHHAADQIQQQQTRFLRSGTNPDTDLAPSDLHITFCFTGGIALIQRIVQKEGQRILTAPGECSS